jgi:hypothetical protein
MSFVSSSESERGNINLVFVFIYSLVVKYFWTRFVTISWMLLIRHFFLCSCNFFPPWFRSPV